MKKVFSRARPGFEPGTSRTLSENHTPRPTSHFVRDESFFCYLMEERKPELLCGRLACVVQNIFFARHV